MYMSGKVQEVVNELYYPCLSEFLEIIMLKHICKINELILNLSMRE